MTAPRYAPLPADVAVRLALQRGALHRDGGQWVFGRRRFNNETVRKMIDRGEAVREGNIVRATAEVSAS